MSTSDAWPTRTDQPTELDRSAPSDPERDVPAEEQAVHGGRLNQPWRAAVAGAEFVVAVGLVLFAWWSWGAGRVPITLPGPDGVDVVTRYVGSWLALSILAGVLAGLLLLDALRQLALAVKVRSRS